MQSKRKRRVILTEELVHNEGKFWCDQPLEVDEREKLRLCDDFYTNTMLEKKFVPLITQQYVVSLRCLDWLATNYSKKLKIPQIRNYSNHEHITDIHSDYVAWLDRHHRVKFDPFCRVKNGKRIYFEHDGNWYDTTIAQLLFLYWAIQYNILDYAEKNVEEINRDMSETMARTRLEKEQAKKMGLKRKRKELSKSSSITCVILYKDTEIHFGGSDSEADYSSEEETAPLQFTPSQ